MKVQRYWISFIFPLLRHFEGHPGVLRNIWYTNEAEFLLHGYVNEQDILMSAKEYPSTFLDAP
jgi:hypothetical protein